MLINSPRIDQRESETFILNPDGFAPFGFMHNRREGLVARSEWLKPDEPSIEPNLEEKEPPQEYTEYEDSPKSESSSSSSGGWDLDGAFDEDAL